MSSFVPIGNPNDMSGFDSALDVLRSMSENGNLAAAEFYHNLEQVKVCLDAYRGASRPQKTDSGLELNVDVAAQSPTAAPLRPISGLVSALAPPSSSANLPGMFSSASTVPVLATGGDLLAGQSSHGPDAYNVPARDTINGYTTEKAFLEPTMQDFLA